VPRAIALGRRMIAVFAAASAVLLVTAGVSIVRPSVLPRAFASTCTITADSSTPTVATSLGNTSGTVTSASFSPPAGSLVVAVVNVGFRNKNSATVSVKDSLGNTWSAGPGLNDGVYDFSGQWWHYFSSAPGSITVTATNSNLAPAGYQLAVRVLTGAASSQAASTGAAFAQGSSTSSAVSHSFTTTTAGSKVFVAAAMGINGTGSAVSGTSTIADTGDSSENAEFLVGSGSSLTGTPGTSTFGWTDTKSGFFAWTAWEILPATGCGTGSGPVVSSFTPASGSSGTSVTVTGSGFTGATAVKFNGMSATFTVTSDTQITATVPSGATTGPIAVTTPAGTGTSTASFTVTTTDQTRKLVVIVEENEGFTDIVGNTSQAPYLNQLIANGLLFTNYQEAAVGSLFNYEAMTSGETTAPVPNIFQAIDGTGGTLTWKEFMESMGGNCATGTTGNVPGTSDPLYTASHDPGFQNQVTDTCSTNDVPLTSSTFNPASLPTSATSCPTNATTCTPCPPMARPARPTLAPTRAPVRSTSATTGWPRWFRPCWPSPT